MRREDKERRTEAADREHLAQLATRLQWLRLSPALRREVLLRVERRRRERLAELFSLPWRAEAQP